MPKLVHFRLTATHPTLCGETTGDVTANKRLVTCPACFARQTPTAIYLLFIDGVAVNELFFSPEGCQAVAALPHHAGRSAIAVRYARDLRTLTPIETPDERR